MVGGRLSLQLIPKSPSTSKIALDEPHEGAIRP